MYINRLYFVRHGESRTNATRVFSHSQSDYSLTPQGKFQTQATAEHLRPKKIHEIYSSPLKRAAETAEIIANYLALQLIVIENFREINVGYLEGHLARPEDWVLHDRIIENWFSVKPEMAYPGREDYQTCTSSK